MMIRMIIEITIIKPIEEDKEAKGTKVELATLNKTLKELKEMIKMEIMLEMILMTKTISEMKDNMLGLLKILVIEIKIDLNKGKIMIFNIQILKPSGHILQAMVLIPMVHILLLMVHMWPLMEVMPKMEIIHILMSKSNKLIL
jgi:hypothetical protein